MSFIVSKLMSVVVFAAWFLVGTLVIRGIEQGAAITKRMLIRPKTI